ncbi:beta-lactamase family protein [bacterium]|nr:beta-lactamase family protein [bacterium]
MTVSVAESLTAGGPTETGLSALFARVRNDIDQDVLPSAQVAIGHAGAIAGIRTFGEAVQGGTRRPATDETLYSLFSATKAIVGAATWALCEDGLLRIEERVAEIIPEFATNGKDIVTVEQVMLHIGGFPSAPFQPGDWDNRERRLQRFAQWRLNWEPGSRFEYHATSAHWVLAEIIERRTGVDFRRYIRQRLLDPMGLHDLYVGLPPEMNDRVADVVHVTPPEPPPGGWGEVTPDAILNFNRPEIRLVGVPGGGGVGGAAQLAAFYQVLINGGECRGGGHVLKPETIEWATRVRTTDQHRDPILGHPVNRALTVVVAGDDGLAEQRGFGAGTSARAFGHAGAGGQIAWGDPISGISLGYCTNGFVGLEAQRQRTAEVSTLAARCSR